jgi:hypothetical protein
MNAKFRFLIILPLVLLLAGTALAQEPEHSDTFWQGTFWNNTSLSGAAALTRQDANLDFDWGSGSPQPGVINPDGFSARWTRYILESAGTYRFTATSDDGIRVWVDGVLIIDDWNDHAARTVTADRYLSDTHHLITVEYYENGSLAVAKLSWQPVLTITNWKGEYFNNTSLSGSPALVRNDTQIQFSWGSGSPAPGTINSDGFSARWTQTLNFTAGYYTFSATTDDGVRLWVNGHLLVDVWEVHSAQTRSGSMYLPDGDAEVKMEYFENTGLATAKLSWTRDGSGTPPPGGSVIVDDNGPGFIAGGSSTSWRTVDNEGYDDRLLWTWNNDRVRSNYNWARWSPGLTAGRYEVFVYIPDRYTTTGSARYWVSHRDGYTLRTISQSANGGQWVSLGTYWFRGTTADYVSLSDVTYETYVSRLIAFDAVRWDPR